MKTRLVFSLAAIIITAQAGLPAPALAEKPVTPAFSAQEQQIYDRLLAFDDALQHRLRYVEKMAAAGREPRVDLGREAERFRHRLRSIEGQVHALEPGSGMAAALLDKVHSFTPVLGNLERAAEIAAVEPVDLSRLLRVRPTPDVPTVRVPFKAGAPGNDACANALPIGNGTFVGVTSTATSEPVSWDCGYSELSPDVWFRYSTPVPAETFANTYGSSFDTVLSVYRGCPETGESADTCNDNSFGLQSAVDFGFYDDEDIYLRVSGFAASSGAFQLNVGPGGAVSGTVTDAATGEPIPSIRVNASPESGYWGGHGVADPAGNYSIAGLAAGTYYVQVGSDSEYVTEIFDDLPCPNGECDPTAREAVQVTLGAVTEGIDFALDLGGRIAGSVVAAATGEPITSARVEIFDAGGDRIGEDWTDDFGRYRVTGLIAGSYFATAEASRYRDELYDDLPCPDGGIWGCDPTTGTPIEVGFGSTTAGIDFVLDRFGEISGTVTDRTTGEGVFARVITWDADGNRSGSDYTYDAGRFIIAGLPAGTYYVQATSDDHVGELYDGLACASEGECDPTAGTPVTVADNTTTSGIDFALARLGAVAGMVTEAATGDLVQGDWDDWAYVNVWTPDGDWAGDDRIESGGYQAERLQAGTYFAVADTLRYLDEVYDDIPCPQGGEECDPTIGTPIAVELDATTSGIDFALTELGAIAGTVSEEVTGEPVEEAWVQVWDSDNRQIGGTQTDTDGRYRVHGLESGISYFVTATPQGYVGELYDDIPCPEGGWQCDPASGMPITVELATTTDGIDFALTRLGAISGTVTEAATGDWIYACVRVWDVNGSHTGGGCTYYDGDGTYTVSGLAAGTYFATARQYRYSGQLYDGLPCPEGCDPTTGTPINVSLDTTTTDVDFTLDRFGDFSGRVRNAVTGELIEYDAQVTVWNAAGEFVYSTWSGYDGYTTEPLEPGTYFAVARGDDYLGEIYREIPCPEDCDPTAGTPITVSLAETVTGIDFTLEPREPSVTDPPGGFTGTVTDERTGQPVRDVRVEIRDADGDSVDSRYSDHFGRYALYLPAGTYFAVARWGDGYHDELYDNLPCGTGVPDGCDPTTGTPITVTSGRMTPGIDFRLRPIVATTCEPTATTLCLAGDRFRVDLDWRDYQDDTGAGRAVELTADTGYFWFFNPDNVEGVVKVLDACIEPFNRFWVFAAGLTDVECALTVTDTWTGETLIWTNPLGVPFAPIQDTAAFATCDAVQPSSAPLVAAGEAERLLAGLELQPLPLRRETPVPKSLALDDKGSCLAGDTALCLNQGRFHVEARWQTPIGESGFGHAVPLTADTGYFWFFNPDNVEVVIKVLDACIEPFDRFWVFAAGLTDVGVTLRLTDTVTGEVREYQNPMGTAFAPIQDTDAFATCQW